MDNAGSGRPRLGRGPFGQRPEALAHWQSGGFGRGAARADAAGLGVSLSAGRLLGSTQWPQAGGLKPGPALGATRTTQVSDHPVAGVEDTQAGRASVSERPLANRRAHPMDRGSMEPHAGSRAALLAALRTQHWGRGRSVRQEVVGGSAVDGRAESPADAAGGSAGPPAG